MLRRSWPLRVLAGLALGAAVGVAVYYASLLKGPNLFILAGATAGAVAAMIVHAYSVGGIRLTDVKVTVPQLSELNFVLTRDTQQVAWRLFKEISSRVAIRPLAAETGRLREALSSLHALVLLTRQILDEVQPSRLVGAAPSVEHLALAMVNNELGPFLSRWHPELHAWEQGSDDRPEQEWPGNAECRADLAAMQSRLRPYVLGFGKLAGMRDETTKALLNGQLDLENAGTKGPISSPRRRNTV
ncbi:hypothetical protein [Micromonospora humida]|uniref:Uncharacterized protein n=1 Tax=Micromonospora humida TaxID=2809018 RepID=A0ABS2IXQ6_9ACTN|nr:hypothetical protein [Micromonospora humida]MBM7077939.1 hypothetical protein [Micromonospora humida]